MRRSIAVGLLFLFAVTSLHANDDVSQSESSKSCREEVWRVYVPTHGPKGAWWPRSEKRTVLVCGESVIAQDKDQASQRVGEDR